MTPGLRCVPDAQPVLPGVGGDALVRCERKATFGPRWPRPLPRPTRTSGELSTNGQTYQCMLT